ncbi:Metacaspase-1 [Diplonema papillatum]|nr:Metacaspase-1 [Diplonema papillatum]|eukprot:gene2737-4261_t
MSHGGHGAYDDHDLSTGAALSYPATAEVRVPPNFSAAFSNFGKCYAFHHVMKYNSGSGMDSRALLLSNLFLVQIKPDGELTRLLPLNRLVGMQYDHETQKCFLKTTHDERDWLFQFTAHPQNQPASPADLFHAINACRQLLVEDHAPLDVHPGITGVPDLERRSEHKSVEMRMNEYLDFPGLKPKPLPLRPSAHQQQEVLTAVYTVNLRTPDEELGIGYRVTDDGTIEVNVIKPNGPFERAGVPRGDLIALDGKEIHEETALLNLVETLRLLGKRTFEVSMTNIGLIPSSRSPTASGKSSANGDGPVEGLRIDNDLHDLFSFSTDSEYDDIAPVVNAGKALIIAVNYTTTAIALSGAGKRADKMSRFLRERGFSKQKVLCDERRSAIVPSRRNIIQGLRWLTRDLKPADNLFLYISGHGTNVPDYATIEGDDDGAFTPLDYKEAGFVTCEEVKRELFYVLPEDCRVFIFCDFFNGGSLVDLPYRIALTPKWNYDVDEEPELEGPTAAIYMLNVLSEDESLPDVGVMTYLFLRVFKTYRDPSLQELIEGIRGQLGDRGIGGFLYPQVSCTQSYDMASERFTELSRYVPHVTRVETPDNISLSSVSEYSGGGAEQTVRAATVKRPARVAKSLPPWLLGKHRGIDLLSVPLVNRQHPAVLPFSVDPAHRKRLIAFYRYHNPDMLHKTTSMLIQYRGREEELFALLVKKYGVEPHDIGQDMLPAGWTKVTSSKGEVFYRHDSGARQWEVPQKSAREAAAADYLPPAPGSRPLDATLRTTRRRRR